jgi:hypothetical protein
VLIPPSVFELVSEEHASLGGEGSSDRLPESVESPRRGEPKTVSSISRSHRQRSAGSGVKDQPGLRKDQVTPFCSESPETRHSLVGRAGLEPATDGL